MDWTKVFAPLLGVLGPVLGGLVAGPAGAAVGGALGKALAEAAGVEATPEAIAAAPPDVVSAAAEKLAQDQALAAQIVALANAETERLKAELLDAQDARRNNALLAHEGHATAWTPTVLALLTLGVFAAVSYLGLIKTFDGIQREIFLFIAGQWSAFAANGLNFFLGSSRSSRLKDDVLADVIKRGGR